jgi:hypothetical protein
MEQEIVFNGKIYRRYPDSNRESDRRYYKTSANVDEKYLHRAVWAEKNGKIPDGYHIHHINGNFLDNDISNLKCLSVEEHSAIHPGNPSMQKYCLSRARGGAIKWHKSKEGSEWHREHYNRYKHKLHAKVAKICTQCGSSFCGQQGETVKFCSNKCKSKHRRMLGIDNEKRTCGQCGTEFYVSKYSKIRTCSIACAGLRRRINRTKTCEHCGKIFNCTKAPQKRYCTPKCFYSHGWKKTSI